MPVEKKCEMCGGELPFNHFKGLCSIECITAYAARKGLLNYAYQFDGSIEKYVVVDGRGKRCQ